MPQIKKNCEILISHPSYDVLYKILKKYEGKYTIDIFLQQVAYNCAIRAIASSYKECLIKYKTIYEAMKDDVCPDYASYGISTFVGIEVGYYEGGDVDYGKYSIAELYLEYPFINNNPPEDYNLSIERYPLVQRPLSAYAVERLNDYLSTNVDFENIILPFSKSNILPEKLMLSENQFINLSSEAITKAFYFYDAIHFYNYSLSMVSRAIGIGKSDYHDMRTIKKYLEIITFYINDKNYFNLLL